MYEWLEGLQKSAKRTAAGVAPEDVQRAETESGNPFPEELGVLFKRFNGGDFQGDVTLFALHGLEGEPSVMEKTRLKLEGLPAAGVWRIGVKGPHRQLFAARKSAMREQSDEPLPGWAEALSDEEWLYGTWETEARELKLYRSFASMIEVLVPPAEVEEFGERTFARALVAVHGRLNDISEEVDPGARSEDEEQEDEEQEDEAREDEEQEDEAREDEDEVVESLDAQDAEASESDEEAEEEIEEAVEEEASESEGDEEQSELEAESAEPEDEEEAGPEDEEEAGGEEDEELRKPVVAAARRRVGSLQKAPEREPVTREEAPQRVAKKGGAKPPARKQSERAAPASRGTSAAKKAAAKKAPAKKAAAQKTPAKKATAKKSTGKASAARKAPAKKAAAKKAPAKKAAAQKTPAKKATAKKSMGKASAARKAPAKKAAAKKSTPQKGASRGRR